MEGINNIVVIGGGPAGLEAAASLKDMGYQPIIVEVSDHLGGHLASWDHLFPAQVSAGELLKSLLERIQGVQYFLRSNVSSLNRLDDMYNVILTSGVTILCRAVVMATGFSLFPAEKKEEYGYGIYNHVITNADLESFYSGNQDERVPENPSVISFVHCVGSRDEKAGNRYCSKVCCATAVKQAIEMKQKFPDATIYCFYMDLRMFGRGYEELYLKAQKEYDIRFVRGRVSEISEDIQGKTIVKAEDTLAGKPIHVLSDLVVLMAGMMPCRESSNIAKMLKLMPGEDGFMQTVNTTSGLNLSDYPGLFFAGTCTGPKTIPETLAEARGAAMAIHRYLKEKRHE